MRMKGDLPISHLATPFRILRYPFPQNATTIPYISSHIYPKPIDFEAQQRNTIYGQRLRD